jgi:flagellar biogenesis protein FliO
MDFTKIFNFVGEIPEGAKYVAALVFVLILILFVSWILKKITAKVRIGGRRGGRLKVQESIMVDTSRTLTLVKCDNVEHLILLGGTNDLVVATNIQKPSPVAKNSPMTVALAPTVQPPAPPSTVAHPAHAAPLQTPAVAPVHHEPPAYAQQPAPAAAQMTAPAAAPQMTAPPQPANPMPANPMPHVPQPTHYKPQQQTTAPHQQPLPTPAPRAKPPAPPAPPPTPVQHQPELNQQPEQADASPVNGEDNSGPEDSNSPSLSNIRPGDEK